MAQPRMLVCVFVAMLTASRPAAAQVESAAQPIAVLDNVDRPHSSASAARKRRISNASAPRFQRSPRRAPHATAPSRERRL
jgi:hypothetical protein